MVQCDFDSGEWESNDDGSSSFNYLSTRESVIRSEAERAGAVLAGQVTALTKEKTGYQLFHMHRVAEIKRDLGVKHHDAFKRAAKDWTRLPESEKDWYNNRADKKPVGRPVKIQGQEENKTLQTVGNAVTHMLFDADVHSSSASLSHPEPPRLIHTGVIAAPVMERDEFHSREHEPLVWNCNVCGIGDAGTPEGSCFMCAAFSM